MLNKLKKMWKSKNSDLSVVVPEEIKSEKVSTNDKSNYYYGGISFATGQVIIYFE